jgi:hypothetical protein
VWSRFEAERPKLVPYAGRFDGFHALPASVSKTCLIRFDNNRYSVGRRARMLRITSAEWTPSLSASAQAVSTGPSPSVSGEDCRHLALAVLDRLARTGGADHDHHSVSAAATPGACRRLRPLRHSQDGKLMERTAILGLMRELKLFGMRGAFDEVMTAAVKRQHEPPRIVGDLLKAEVAEKQARSIKYQLSSAKLPLAKDIADFAFDGTPINDGLVRDLAAGGFLTQQRNVVLVGGTGTGKAHLAIAIARSCIRSGARGRFFNVVDLVNRLDGETRGGKQGRLADYLTRHAGMAVRCGGRPKSRNKSGTEGAAAVDC